MEISGSMSIAAQEMAINKSQAGFDVLTKTLQKTEQHQQNEQQRLQVAEQTGKGMNIDIKA
ncbi:MAG: hypothetical protein KAT62_06085 [Desulfuromonadales bacterium]|nr:hypothetical protein [Chloroflexota bacterium]MCK4621769.1 hypothetical protein [Desulfuromonadales bacterium]